MAAMEKKLYCICNSEYQKSQFMIECDRCKDWFHGRCVGISESQASSIDIYHCPLCEQIHGPSTFKRKRSTKRQSYKNIDNEPKPIFTGTIDFMKKLKTKNFDSCSNTIDTLETGYLLTSSYLETSGFQVPILVKHVNGLGLALPPSSFTVFDIEQHVGSMEEIHVIDVAKQEDIKMKMKEWTEYYNSPIRTKVLNVISLEFSKTRLSSLVSPPIVVQDVSWVENVWPKDVNEESPHSMPLVQKFCLMGVKDCYTDFHVDFGGTSVWYHVFRGEKVFYLIEPSDENLAKYENWVSSPNQSQIFFGDRVSKCMKCPVKQGETLFIPAGWIHAVMTPSDTLVFGGNFLHSASIDLQLRIYELEQRLSTPIKFLFPNYETTCWYAARAMLRKLKEIHREGVKIPRLLFKGIETLVRYLRGWVSNKEEFLKFHKFQVPEEVNCAKLLKALDKELKVDMEMSLVSPKRVNGFPTIVMRDAASMPRMKSPDRSGSSTVIKLKLTGPNPNTGSDNRQTRKRKVKGDSAKERSIRTGALVTSDVGDSVGRSNRKLKLKQKPHGSDCFSNQRESSSKVSISRAIKVQVTNGKISEGDQSMVKGFQPLLQTEISGQPADCSSSEVNAQTIEYQDWEAAQLLSNFHGVDLERGTELVRQIPCHTANVIGHPTSGPNLPLSTPKAVGFGSSDRERLSEQIGAVKKDLLQTEGGHELMSIKKAYEYDDYVVREPLAKPQGKLKKSYSDSDSDYDPNEEYYQDANYVYPRLNTTSDLDSDDFAWNPGQRSKRNVKSSFNCKSKLNSRAVQLKQQHSLNSSKSRVEENSRCLKDAQSSAKANLAGDKKREKVRKGTTTAKQRLGKLLKLDKLGGRYLR